MTDWCSKLDLRDIWKSVENDKMTVQELSSEIAKRLKKVNPHKAGPEIIFMRNDIIEQFEDLAEEKEVSFEEFNYIMDDLYDWGDAKLDDKGFGGKKVCWIATTF